MSRLLRGSAPLSGTLPGARSAAPPVVAVLMTLVALAVGGGCSDDATPVDELVVRIISVSPEAGFAPATIQFGAEVEDSDGTGLTITWDFGNGSGSTGSLNVSSLYEAPGTYEVEVTVTDASGATGRAVTSVEIYRQAELRVSAPVPGSRAVRTGDDLRVTFDLFNDAGEVPVPFDIGVYLALEGSLSPTNPPGVAEIGELRASGGAFRIGTINIESFGGEGTTENLDVTDIEIPATVPSGTYDVFVFADDGGVVGELDEDNNVRFSADTVQVISTAQAGPDLLVTRVRARPSLTNLLDRVTIDIDFENVGSEPSGAHSYAVYLSFANGILDSADTLIADGTISGIASQGSVEEDNLEITLEGEARGVLIGQYFVLVEIDSEEDVDEVNESNNVGASNAIEVTDRPIPGIDILPTAFDFDPGTTFLDGSVTLSSSVINQGVEDMDGQFFCRVYMSTDDDLDFVEDQVLYSFNYPALRAGEERAQEAPTPVPGFFEPDLYTLFLFCDPSQQIPEADEDNNVFQAEGELEVNADPVINLRWGSFEVSPRTVTNEEEVTIDMEVCNDGSNGVGPSIAQIRISQDPILDAADTLLAQHTVSPIEANGCQTITITAPAICDTFNSSYVVFATLDVTNLLPETDETDNQLTLDTELTIEGVICECVVDPLEADNDSPATPTFVTSRTYCDLTMCDTAVDWYAVPLQRGETVRAFITFDDDRGNLDLLLYRADRARIFDRSEGEGDREEVIGFVVPETGDYLLKVSGRTELDVNAYCMTIEVTPPESGTDLIVTQVETDNARPVLGEEVRVGFEVINLGDTDAAPSTVRAYLSEDIDIDPGVDAFVGELLLTEGVAASSALRRSLVVEMPLEGPGGPRYVGVVADALNDVPGELDETNNVGISDVIELDAGCFDSLEPNNAIDDPAVIELGADVINVPDLLVCSENGDFYQLCGDAGDFLTVRARFSADDGDIDLRLYDEAGTVLQRAEGVGSEEIVDVDYLAADQCFVLEVLVVGRGREVPYDLVVESGPAPDELRCSGAGEPNESFATAPVLTDLLDPVDDDLAVCPVTDDDYYQLTLSAGTRVELRFVPGDGESTVPGGLRMTLYNPSRSFLRNTVSATEPLVYTATSTGRHYLRVSSQLDAPRNQRYQIEVSGLGGVDLLPIDFEIDPGVVEAGDRVEYGFTIENARTTAAGASHYGIYLSADPLIDTASDTLLVEPAVTSIPGSSSRAVGGRVTIPDSAPTGQIVYLGAVVDSRGAVTEFTESNNVALVPLQILADCVRDGAEPNDARIDAQDLEDFLGVELFLCPDDRDWFVFEASRNTNYVLSATFELDEGEGDLDFFVYDASGELIAEGGTIGEDETVAFRVTGGAATQTVFIEAAPFGTTNFAYTLDLTEP
jgi:hypothetical protein